MQQGHTGLHGTPIIKNDNGLGDYYVDPMEVLAEKVILFSGKKLKQQK